MKLKRILAVIMCVAMLFTAISSLGMTVNAASYPLISFNRDESTPTIVEGYAGYLKFTIFTEYKNESYTVQIYDSDDNLCAEVSDTYYNYNTYMRDVTINVNTKDLDLKAGEYTVVYYVGYYTYFEWREAPNKYETKLTILKNKCKGNHTNKLTYSFKGSCTYEGYNEFTCSKCGNITFEKNGYSHTPSLEGSKLVCSECDKAITKPTLFKVGKVYKYFKNGTFNTATGLVKHSNGKYYYIEKGIVKNNINGLKKINNKWYYFKNGIVNMNPALVKYNNSWFYVNKGTIDKANTLCKYNGKWFHVSGGKLVKDTTLVKYNGKWYYIKNGVMTKSTTLVKYKGVWYYVKNGVMNKSNTLCKYSGKYYHVKNGKMVKDTTIVKYGGKRYYVKSGVVTKVTGRVKISGKYYKVKNGVVL